MNFNLFKSLRVIPVGAWQTSSEQKSHRTIEEEKITWKKICQNDKITIFIGCFELVTRQKIFCVRARSRTSLAQPSIVTQNATNGRPICISTWTVTANTNSRTNTRVTPTIDLYDYYFSVVCLMHFFNFWFLTTKKAHTHSPNYIIIAIPIQMNNSAYTPLIVPKKIPPESHYSVEPQRYGEYWRVG